MERRGRIPVAKFRTQEGKTRSRSRVREPDYNEQDPETDLFTLLEDNIALKEENKALKLEIEDHKKIQNELLEDNTKMRDELDTVIIEQTKLEEEIRELSANLAKTNSDRIALDKMQKIQVEKNEALTLELQQKRTPSTPPAPTMLDSVALQSKLLKILPDLSANEMESLMDVETTASTPVNSELVERLVDEFLALKNLMNSVELQLYEANEKIAELLENQHHMEEENEAIRTENTNLTRVAKLLTENMKESVETSKKMEAALIKLKQRNEELLAKSRGDFIDGLPDPRPSPTTLKANAEFEEIQKEAHSQNLDHGERIVEMKNLMEAAIQKNTNEELKKMQLKMEILEEELRQALARASKAESELQTYKNLSSSESEQQQVGSVSIQASPSPPLLPPPPPPPLPTTLLYKPTTLNISKRRLHEGCVTENSSYVATAAAAAFGVSDGTLTRSNSSGGGDKIISSVMQQVQAEAATGVDALVRELKSGRVTLRRNRRKTRTNEALQEMFQVLEISQKQNRDSKICIDLHI